MLEFERWYPHMLGIDLLRWRVPKKPPRYPHMLGIDPYHSSR